jgi:hypothetical protein
MGYSETNIKCKIQNEIFRIGPDYLKFKRYIMKRTLILLIILLSAPVFMGARRSKGWLTECTFYPAKALEAGPRYQLLPSEEELSEEELSEEDALPLYEKAVKALPENLELTQIAQWVKITTLDELPREKVKSTIEQLRLSLQLLEQAGRCKPCNWPFAVVLKSEILGGYRKLAYALALQARLQMAEGQYEDAIGTIRTGLTMGRHLSKSSALEHGLNGIAISALMFMQLDELIQAPDAPNLYQPLHALPRPLIDLTEQVEFVENSLRDRVHLLMNRLDRHVAAVQCIEALRHYSAIHNGKLPISLAEITEVTIPNDPVTQKPFIYRRSGSEAILKGPAPKGSDNDEALDCRLILKEIEIEQQSKMPKNEQKQ